MAPPPKLNLNLSLNALTLIVLLLVLQITVVAAEEEQCEKSGGGCHDKGKAMKLKIIAIVSILITSMIGVCLPLFSRSVPALKPERDLFVVVKLFASGVILATGYMHVLPDSFDCLTSPCLPDNPWHKFPFSAFVAMLFAMVTLMLDSLALSYYRKRNNITTSYNNNKNRNAVVHHHHHHQVEERGIATTELEATAAETAAVDDAGKALLRNRVVAQVLEFGIVVHSVVIGLSMGASDNPCTIRPLIAALCFHQLFEGMGLGGCILQAEYKMKTKAIMVFFFSTTTPFGIVLGILLSNVYSEDSPTALIVVGLLNAASAGLLNYMALVDLLGAEFLGPKLQASVKLQIWGFTAALLGAGIMSLMAKWA